MVLPRPSSLRGAQSFGRIASRRAGIQARSTLKNLGRRTYASGHEAKQSSDVPWMIGAVVFTVPAATWLLGQGPSKSDHGHGHGEHEEKHEEVGEEEATEEESGDTKDEPEAESRDEGKDDKESKDDSAEDAKADAKDDSKDENEEPQDGKADSKEDAKDDDSGDSKAPNDEEYDGPSSGKKAQYFRNPNKKPGEGQKGDRPPTEKKGEKDSKGNYSGAQHPNISDPSKSRKSAGVTETAKLHGTAKPTYANPTEPASPETPKETSERA